MLLPVNTLLRRLHNLAKNLGTMTSIVIGWYRNERTFWATRDAPVTFRKGDLSLKIKKDTIEVNIGGPAIFYYNSAKQFINTISMINHQFLHDQYSWLDPKNKIVIDVGANIADSSMYFALKGAKKVYALEPSPYSYSLAKKNIRLSGMEDRITLLNNAGGGAPGFVHIDSDAETFGGADLKHLAKGKRIGVVTLKGLLSRYELGTDCLLKMDCEGAERDIIINSDINTLRKFDRIMLEYHYGYLDIEKKLKAAGFKVKHTAPVRSFNPEAEKTEMVIGLITAEKTNE